jgi:hypothetical protein
VTKKRVGGNLRSAQPTDKRSKVNTYDDEFANFSTPLLKELYTSVGLAASSSGSLQELIER